MLAINAIIEAMPGKEREMEDALRKMIPNVKNEKDTYIYTLHRSTDNPAKFVFYELYKDKEAVDYHMSTEYFKQLGKDIEKISKNISIDICEVIDGIPEKYQISEQKRLKILE